MPVTPDHLIAMHFTLIAMQMRGRTDRMLHFRHLLPQQSPLEAEVCGLEEWTTAERAAINNSASNWWPAGSNREVIPGG